MKKKKSILQSLIIIICLLFILGVFLYQLYHNIQWVIIAVQREHDVYIGWDMNNTAVTSTRLLALGGLLDAKWAGVLDNAMGTLTKLSSVITVGILLYFIIRCQKEIRPFTRQSFKYIKIVILLMMFFPCIEVFSRMILLVVTQPPVDWYTVIHSEVANLMKLLFNVVVYTCLLYSWQYGISLQNAADEAI